VESSLEAFETIDSDRVLRVRYEDLVTDPAAALEGLSAFAGIPTPDLSGHPAFTGISPRSLGRGRSDLGTEGVARLRPIVAPALERLGYEDST